MKIETNNKSENFGHKKFEFRIDAKHQFKAIWALINLYQNKIGTPVQEIISNARDAHREAGKPDHSFIVNITESEFYCRDFGLGIDPEKAEEVICSIGCSTKNGDNKSTGGFGLGIKSPLAYTNSFTIESYIDGTMYTYVIAKNGEMLEMNLVDTSNTNEVNGTKVMIPIKDKSHRIWQNDKYVNVTESGNFIKAVQRTCLFWDAKPTFNHKHSQIDVMELKTVSNGGVYAKNEHVSGNIVVIDGLPYKINSFGGKKVAYFNTGDIRLHETRERLADNHEDNDHNTSKIRPVLNAIENDIDKVDKYIDKDKLFESFKELAKYKISFSYRLNGFVFRSNNFTFENKSEFTIYSSEKGQRYPYNMRYKKDTKTYTYYSSEYYYNDLEEKTTKCSRRIKGHLLKSVDSGNEKTIVLLEKGWLATLLGAKKVSTLEIPKIVRTGEKVKNEEITINELTNWGQNRLYKKVSNITKSYLYIGYTEDFCNSTREFLAHRGYNICKLSKANIEAVKDSVKFTDCKEYLANLVLTAEEKERVYSGALYRHGIDVNKDVLDGKITELNKLSNSYRGENSGYLIPSTVFTEEITKELEVIKGINTRIQALCNYSDKAYPLISRNSDHNTDYINAMYTYRSEK